PEVDYWNSSIVAFVLGANPPEFVMDGYLRRVWKDYRVDKEVTFVLIVYEWRPKVCSKCKRIGHAGKDCYAKQPKQRQ
ncbi:Gag-Pol polyprotein, partial [Bienertia sinuspersici]